MHKVLAAAALGCSMLTSAAYAVERPRHTISMESVRTDDLDLNTPTGAHRMLRRITGAAGSACFQTPSDSLPRITYANARCEHDAIARAVGELNAPLVTSAYETWSNAPSRSLAAR
jgi:UrcA family protein